MLKIGTYSNIYFKLLYAQKKYAMILKDKYVI